MEAPRSSPLHPWDHEENAERLSPFRCCPATVMGPFHSQNTPRLALAAAMATLALATPAQAPGLVGGSREPGMTAAALAIPAVALIVLRARREGAQQGASLAAVASPVVALGMAVHVLLQGLEVPSQGVAALGWLGALVGSAPVCGGSMLALRRLPALRTVAPSALLRVGGCLTVAALLAQGLAFAG